MRKKTTKPKTPRKQRHIRNWFAKAGRFLSRVVWARVATQVAALIGFIVVESAVAEIVWRYAPDEATARIIVSIALMGGVGVMFGPSLAVRFRGIQRKLAWGVIAVCLAVSCWNLSSSLENGQNREVADAITGVPTYTADLQRLARLDRMVDALADELGNEYDAYRQERDELRARLAGANPAPVVIAKVEYWVKAFMFHGLVAGFSAAFAGPLLGGRRRTSKKATQRTTQRGVKAQAGNVSYADF